MLKIKGRIENFSVEIYLINWREGYKIDLRKGAAENLKDTVNDNGSRHGCTFCLSGWWRGKRKRTMKTYLAADSWDCGSVMTQYVWEGEEFPQNYITALSERKWEMLQSNAMKSERLPTLALTFFPQVMFGLLFLAKRLVMCRDRAATYF